MVFTYKAAKEVLNNKDVFKVTWGGAIEFLMGPAAKHFMLAGDGPKNEDSRKMMGEAIYGVRDWNKEVRNYYEKKMRQLLEDPDRSYKLAGVNQTDIIRDISNMAHVHFASDLFSLPLKTEANERGLITEQQMYMIMSAVFICVFFDLDPANSFPLRQKAHEATQMLGQLVEKKVAGIGSFLDHIGNIIFPDDTPLRDYGDHLIERLRASGMPVKDLVWGHIMGTVGGMVPNQGQLFGQTIEFYLRPENKGHLEAIQKLAAQESEDAYAQLERYFLEGSRLNGETAMFRLVEKDYELVDGKRTLKLKKGDKIMLNLRAASQDPSHWPKHNEVVLDRPIDDYIHLGDGAHKCLGWEMTRVAMTAMLKVVGGLKGLRPAPGPQGKVHKVLKPLGPGAEGLPENWLYHLYLTEFHERFWPFPVSLKVNWDDE